MIPAGETPQSRSANAGLANVNMNKKNIHLYIITFVCVFIFLFFNCEFQMILLLQSYDRPPPSTHVNDAAIYKNANRVSFLNFFFFFPRVYCVRRVYVWISREFSNIFFFYHFYLFVVHSVRIRQKFI